VRAARPRCPGGIPRPASREGATGGVGDGGSAPRARPIGARRERGPERGRPRILPLLTLKRAPFGIFGQVWESGARAIDGAQAPLAPGASSEQLHLNPGAADRPPWPMAGGTKVAGQATVLTIQGRRATAEIRRRPG